MPRRATSDEGGVLARLGLARRARDARCVEQLTALRTRARAEGLRVVRVRELRRVGVRGSAAWTVLDDGSEIDSWFWAQQPPVGCYLLVRAEVRPGSHSDQPVLFVGRGEPLECGIIEALPARVTAAAARMDEESSRVA
jgi:hypothetical protein